jgi:hypothetical protein
MRKIHAIEPNILFGIAGAVQQAFELLGNFTAWARENQPGDQEEPLSDWLRLWLSTLPQPNDSSEQCRLMVLRASELIDFGPPEVKTGLAFTEGCLLRPGLLEVQPIPFATAASIGSGSAVQAYVGKLEEIGQLQSVMQLMRLGEGMGLAMAAILTETALHQRLEPSVSEHLLVFVASRSGIWWSTNENLVSEGMPPIANSWDEVTRVASRADLANVRA